MKEKRRRKWIYEKSIPLQSTTKIQHLVQQNQYLVAFLYFILL